MRHRPATIAFLLLFALAACKGDPAAAPAQSPGTEKQPVVTLIVNNLTLQQGRDGAAIVGLDAAGGSASVIVVHSPKARIDLFLLAAPTDPIPARECALSPGARPVRSCVRDVGTGVRETLDRPGRAGAMAIVLRSGSGRVDLRFEYDEGSRAVSLRLPSLAPLPGASACKDNGCNPYLEMMPVRAGAFTATATFEGRPARLQLQAGRVIAKSFTATGLPYRIPAEQRGASSLSIATRLDAPAEYALAFMNENPSQAISAIVLEARWP